MSSVSGVLLQVDCIDDREDNVETWRRVDDWLLRHDSGPFGPLLDVTDGLIGQKHPQTYVCGSGYNYFPEEDFAAFVVALPWARPGNVVLVINPEDGPTKVFRPQTAAAARDEIRDAFVAGIEIAETGDIARYDSWSAAADDFVKNREG